MTTEGGVWTTSKVSREHSTSPTEDSNVPPSAAATTTPSAAGPMQPPRGGSMEHIARHRASAAPAIGVRSPDVGPSPFTPSSVSSMSAVSLSSSTGTSAGTNTTSPTAATSASATATTSTAAALIDSPVSGSPSSHSPSSAESTMRPSLARNKKRSTIHLIPNAAAAAAAATASPLALPAGITSPNANANVDARWVTADRSMFRGSRVARMSVIRKPMSHTPPLIGGSDGFFVSPVSPPSSIPSDASSGSPTSASPASASASASASPVSPIPSASVVATAPIKQKAPVQSTTPPTSTGSPSLAPSSSPTSALPPMSIPAAAVAGPGSPMTSTAHHHPSGSKAAKKGFMTALRQMMHTAAPDVPVNVTYEFGPVHKCVLAPAKAFHTPDEFRLWLVAQCGSRATMPTASHQSNIQLEVFREDCFAFTPFFDLSDLVEGAWFRLTLSEEPDPRKASVPDVAALLANPVSPSSPALPSDSKFASISKFDLRFTDGMSTLAPVDSEVTDTFTVRNTTSNPVAYAVALLTDATTKYSLTFRPSDGLLRPGESVEVVCTLLAHCTTSFSADIAVSVQCPGIEDRQVTTLSAVVMTQPTSRLDFDEIKLQQPPVGSGASGTVYRGLWRGQEVAVKVMVAQEERKEFEKEVDMLEQLRSPYIVSWIGAVHEPKRLSIVSEFLTLGSVLSAMTRKRFSWPLKLKCLLDTARGMCFLHSSGIMHRDLKPDNLMMAALSPHAPVCCKITDFGSTRAIGSAALGLKTAGVGTPVYMAPEVLECKPYSTPCDVYSYALIIWYFCNDIQPYNPTEFPTPWAVSDFVIRGKRLPLPENAPPGLSSLMVRCWDAIPARRPSFFAIAEVVQGLFDNALLEHQQERQSRKSTAATSTTTPSITPPPGLNKKSSPN